MHRKGSYLFGTFKTEIETLLNIFDAKLVDKSSFFKERIGKMLRIVKELRTHLQKAKNAMLNVDGDSLEKNIFSGLRGKEYDWFKSQNDVDIWKLLQNAGEISDKIRKALYEYESKSQNDV